MPRGQLSVEQRLRQTISRLKHENALLRERVAFLEKENTLLKTQMGDVLVQLEELKRKVFGKKKMRSRRRDDFGNPSDSSQRPAESYRRSPPAEEDITDTRETSAYKTVQRVRVVWKI